MNMFPSRKKDFTTRANKDAYGHLRNIDKEKKIETEITRIIRENFSFRYIVVDDQAARLWRKLTQPVL